VVKAMADAPASAGNKRLLVQELNGKQETAERRGGKNCCSDIELSRGMNSNEDTSSAQELRCLE
jgi:hypothetical protein